jgi:hypothetical protein
MTNLSREETAAHVLAVIQAKFERPSVDVVVDILQRAERQATASMTKRVRDACEIRAGA